MTCILQIKFDDIVGRIVQAIKDRGNLGPDGVVAFSIQIYETKVLIRLETSPGYKALIGFPYPYHFLE